MAGRPRQYASAAEKMAAYRARQEQRTLLADRANFEQTQQLLARLMDAVHAAARAGEPVASGLEARTQLGLLESLAAHFESQARLASPKR